MNLSAHDQAKLVDIQNEFDSSVGEKPTPVFIANWKELEKVDDSDTHTIKIEEGSGWVISKETGDHDEYLSTHTFYGSCYQWSSQLLQKYGFNVQLKNWDE